MPGRSGGAPGFPVRPSLNIGRSVSSNSFWFPPRGSLHIKKGHLVTFLYTLRKFSTKCCQSEHNGRVCKHERIQTHFDEHVPVQAAIDSAHEN